MARSRYKSYGAVMSDRTSSKGKITVVVSFLALGISAATAFFNFFLVRDDLRATIITTGIGPEFLTLEVTFLNSGDRPVQITNAYLVKFRENDSIVFGPIERPKGFPVVVRPNDFTAPVRYQRKFKTQQLWDFGGKPDKDFQRLGQEFRKIEIGLSIMLIDSSGTVTTREIPALTFHVAKNGAVGNGQRKSFTASSVYSRCSPIPFC